MKPAITMIAIGTVVFIGIMQSGCGEKRVSTNMASRESGHAAAEKTNGYILLADGSIHFDSDGPPSGLFLRGNVPLTRKLKPDHIDPVGDVRGDGPLGQGGAPGWMELTNGSFFGAQTARAPFKPYLNGYRDEAGKFSPSSRTVVY
jgi:hypothetical protein